LRTSLPGARSEMVELDLERITPPQRVGLASPGGSGESARSRGRSPREPRSQSRMAIPSSEPRYRLRLRSGRDRSVRQGHPWIFSGAVEEIEALEGALPGDVGDVVDA